MPAQISQNIEKKVSKDGQLVVMFEDDFVRKVGKTEMFLWRDEEQIKLHPAGQIPFPRGIIRLNVTGFQLDDHLVFEQENFQVLSVEK